MQVNQLEDGGSESDDAESESAANGSPSSQPQDASAKAAAAAVPTHATGEPPSEGRVATEPPAKHAVGTTAALAISDGPASVAKSQQAVGTPAQLHPGGTDTADAAATEVHGGCDAGASASMQTPVRNRPESASCQVAPAASELVKPEAADAAEKPAPPLAVSEADEQFEVLCRALLAASQVIATVRPLFDTDRVAQQQIVRPSA